MDGWQLGEASLDLVPRWVGRVAALALTAGLMTHAGWALGFVDAYAKHQAAVVMRVMTHAVPPTRAVSPQLGPTGGR